MTAAAPRGPIAAVLFDVMDTLIEDPFFQGIEGFFGCSRLELLAAIDREVWPRFERGQLDAATFYRTMLRGDRPVDGAALEAWLAPRYRWRPGAREAVEALHAAGLPLGALSNYPVWMELLDQRCGLSRWLDLDHVSYRTGARKPEPAAWAGACARLGLAPGAILFVDDREANCAAAAAFGMQAALARPGADLRACLPAPLRALVG
jgi:HAD superfamily hydrolase (TIGR01509 family)